MTLVHRLSLRRIALCVSLAVAAPAFAQNTTSAIGGRVTSADGKPVAGASVSILHVESGSVSTVTTDAEGRYTARGLRAGGPYTVTISKDGQTDKRDGVVLALAETASVDGRLGAVAEKIVVTGSGVASDRFNNLAMGAGTSIGRQELDAFASIQRNLQDYARADPRLAQTDKERGEISAGGQNTRFNSVTIDGVTISDTFGLEANNLPTLKQPVSIDAIESVQVNLSNYDVTQKGYTGANINAATKSGTNKLKGSVYYVFRDDKWVGQRYVRTNDSYVDAPKFEETTVGATLGLPIIKDRLFLFANYEMLNSTRNAPAFGPLGSGSTNVGITPSLISSAQTLAQQRYNFNIGSSDIPSGTELEVKDALLKLDWNIAKGHRASFRYTKTEQQEPFFPNLSATALSLNSNWYTQKKEIETLVGQWFADWSPSFSTELKVSQRDYNSFPENNASSPQVLLQVTGALPAGTTGVPTGTRTLFFGTERSRHFNLLDTKTLDTYAAGNWLIGDHEVKFGGDYSKNEVYNAFLQDTKGNYTFSCVNSSSTYTYSFGAITCATATAAQVEAAILENFQRGRPSSFQVQVAAPGKTLGDAVAIWSLENLGLFAQDTWNVNKNLTVTYGARLDTPKIAEKPIANAAAAAPTVAGNPATGTRQSGGFGRDNTVTIDGQDLFQPRVGFNWTFDSKRPMQLRGGFGLFQGAAANVWLSNPFSNTGVATRIIGCGGAFGACPASGGIFSSDPNNQPTNFTGASPAANVDFISGALEQPSVWKANLAFETELPWWNIIASAEYLYTKTKTGIYYQHLNLGDPTRTGPDGRQLFYTAQGYNPACWSAGGVLSTTGATCTGARTRALSNPSFANVLLAEKTGGGGGDQITVALSRPLRHGYGWSLSYTRTSAKEVSPLTSSVANSNWISRSIFNPNEDVSANAAYLIRDRFNASLNFQRAFFGNYRTTIGLFYEGRRGKPYSWTFINDMNGDGVAGNDLMYIPSGPGSGQVVFLGDTATSRTNEDRFWSIVDSFDGLRDARGGVVKRNSEFAPWTNSIDARLSQEFPGFMKGNKATVSLDILNVGNLLNKKWGRINEIGFTSAGGFTRTFVNYAGIDSAGRYIYSLANLKDFTTRQERGESQWALQMTLRYEF